MSALVAIITNRRTLFFGIGEKGGRRCRGSRKGGAGAVEAICKICTGDFCVNWPVVVSYLEVLNRNLPLLKVVKKMGGIKGLFKGGNMNQQVPGQHHPALLLII